MHKFNLASGSPDPQGEGTEAAVGTGEGGPQPGAGTSRRLLVVLGAVVIVAGGGYLALTQFTQFMGPKPAPPARPVRPIAKAPAPPAASPAPSQGAPTPVAQAPAPTGQRGEPAPAAVREAKGAPPAKAEPGSAQAAPGAPPTSAAPSHEIPKAPPAEAAAGAGTFSLQVGAMINEGNAQKLRQRLEQMGYTSSVRKAKAFLRRHVVTTGDFGDRAGADEAAKRLAAQGIAGKVNGGGGRFSVEAGSFANEDDAIDVARQLQRLNFPPRIQDLTQNATIYQVRVGSFPSRGEAQAKGAELKAKGFPYLVVKN